jgi:SAM-dependent methyltransferase
MKIGEDSLVWLSRWLLRRQREATGDDMAHTLTEDAHAAWRNIELEHQLRRNFPLDRIRGRHVLDFGCGGGALVPYLVGAGAASVLGTDLAIYQIRNAQRRAEEMGLEQVAFRLAEDPARIDCEDASFDLICVFDLLQHITCPEEIVREWRRVLRPGGQVWIWWSPWRHPYGHHLMSLVPVPWAHIFFSDKTLMAAAARIYDDPVFVPRLWDIDGETGHKKPNKWRAKADQSDFLNKITLRRLRAICRQTGLTCQVKRHGFGEAGGVKRLAAWLAFVPAVGEYFTSYFTIVLTRQQ